MKWNKTCQYFEVHTSSGHWSVWLMRGQLSEADTVSSKVRGCVPSGSQCDSQVAYLSSKQGGLSSTMMGVNSFVNYVACVREFYWYLKNDTGGATCRFLMRWKTMKYQQGIHDVNCDHRPKINTTNPDSDFRNAFCSLFLVWKTSLPSRYILQFDCRTWHQEEQPKHSTALWLGITSRDKATYWKSWVDSLSWRFPMRILFLLREVFNECFHKFMKRNRLQLEERNVTV